MDYKNQRTHQGTQGPQGQNSCSIILDITATTDTSQKKTENFTTYDPLTGVIMDYYFPGLKSEVK